MTATIKLMVMRMEIMTAGPDWTLAAIKEMQRLVNCSAF